jgi:hypothetical protein
MSPPSGGSDVATARAGRRLTSTMPRRSVTGSSSTMCVGSLRFPCTMTLRSLAFSVRASSRI